MNRRSPPRPNREQESTSRRRTPRGPPERSRERRRPLSKGDGPRFPLLAISATGPSDLNNPGPTVIGKDPPFRPSGRSFASLRSAAPVSQYDTMGSRPRMLRGQVIMVVWVRDFGDAVGGLEGLPSPCSSSSIAPVASQMPAVLPLSSALRRTPRPLPVMRKRRSSPAALRPPSGRMTSDSALGISLRRAAWRP